MFYLWGIYKSLFFKALKCKLYFQVKQDRKATTFDFGCLARFCNTSLVKRCVGRAFQVGSKDIPWYNGISLTRGTYRNIRSFRHPFMSETTSFDIINRTDNGMDVKVDFRTRLAKTIILDKEKNELHQNISFRNINLLWKDGMIRG